MHCALVEAMGTQTDKQKSTNKPMREIINTVRKEAERLNKSGPKSNTFEKIRHVYSEHNRPVVTEADLTDKTLREQRVLVAAKREMAFRTDVSQRWSSTILMLMQVLTNWSVLTLMYNTSGNENPLEDHFAVILQVFSICFRVLVFLRLSQGTHSCNTVRVVAELRFLLTHTLNMKERLQIYNPAAVPQGKNLFEEDNYVVSEYKEPAVLKPLATDTRERLRRAVVKRFLQEDYAAKKHNRTRDYTIDICMYLCPITFQAMHRPGSHMQVFLDALDNNTHHCYYTVQEILEGTVDRIKEMMRTAYKNRKDRVNKEKESSVHAAAKKQKIQGCLNFTGRSGGAAVASLVAASTQAGPAPQAAEVSMEEVIRVELDAYQRKAMTVKLPDPNSAQVHEVCTLEEPDEWWAYQRKIGNSFPLLYEVWQCVSGRPMSSGQIERDFGAASDVLTLKRGSTDPRYFQAQTIACVNFPWLPEPADMPVTAPSIKTVDSALPGNGFGVPDIYVAEAEKDEEGDRLFLDSDGDYGEETCED
jgi:hypothetical protein